MSYVDDLPAVFAGSVYCMPRTHTPATAGPENLSKAVNILNRHNHAKEERTRAYPANSQQKEPCIRTRRFRPGFWGFGNTENTAKMLLNS